MKNNVYGIIGISAINSSWNSNWEGVPKTDGSGNLIASPFALKYCMKVEWNEKHHKVMGLKTLKIDGECNNQNDRYTHLFSEDIKNEYTGTGKKKVIKENNYIKVTNNLLSCIDILNFGTVYTGVNSQSITGVVQIRDGIDKFEEDTQISTEQMLSPYANSNNSEATQTTCGSRSIVDEAHFLHDFSINPRRHDKYINEGFVGYTEKDYEDFKQSSLISVTKISSVAKNGCNNEFAIFVKVKEGDYLNTLHTLSDCVKVYRVDKVIYEVEELYNLLMDMEEEIENVELYFNPRTITLKGWVKDSKFKLFDIITRKEM